VRVTSKGQVTIPKEVRDKLGIQSGSDVGFAEVGGQVVLVNNDDKTEESRGERMARLLVEFGDRMRREGKMEPLGMSVDEYMDLIRGYSEDADDPGFKRHS
jgi:AbrB family looped-hinge helix DNA binding protein